jgi:hypothetical protein
MTVLRVRLKVMDADGKLLKWNRRCFGVVVISSSIGPRKVFDFWRQNIAAPRQDSPITN